MGDRGGKLRIKLLHPGNFAVVLELVRADGTPLETEPTTLRIRDLAYDEARAACDACDGVWGPHGMRSTIGCICRTRDAGAECRDGLACEGECEPKRTEDVVVGGVVRGRRWVGTCSAFRARFGCHSRIPDGALLADLLPIRGGHRTPMICSD